MLTIKDIKKMNVHPSTVERLLKIYTIDTPIKDMSWSDVSRIDLISDEAIMTIFASVGIKIAKKDLKLARKANYEYYCELAKIEAERLANFEIPPVILSEDEIQEFYITDELCSFCSTEKPLKVYGYDLICKECYIKQLEVNIPLFYGAKLNKLQLKACYQQNRM